MIDWRPAGTWPEHAATCLVRAEQPAAPGPGLPPAWGVFLAYPTHDLASPVPDPKGPGVVFPRVWHSHPDGRPFAAGVTVTHWALFNGPEEKP